jgi:hypothetical protein
MRKTKTCRRYERKVAGFSAEIDTRSAVVEYVREHNPLCLQAGGEVHVTRGLGGDER